MRNVLVTAIGSFSADIVIKNLKKLGFNVVGCDIYPKEWIVDSYNVSSFYRAPYATNESEYIKFIYDICKKENINFIFPLTDIEVDIFNKNRNLFEAEKIKVCISSEDTIELCRDKAKIARFLSRKNICNTIKTQLLTEINIDEIDFPVVCKPYNGRSSQGLKYINTIEELEAFIKNSDISNYIIQPFISGDIITVDIVRQAKTNQTVAICRKELLRTQNGAGTSVYVFSNNDLERDAINIANELDINGCVNFEFIEDSSGNMHFIECNPRFSGGVEFSCIAGYDCVLNHIKCFINKEIDNKFSIKNQYICRKYEEYVTSIY